MVQSFHSAQEHLLFFEDKMDIDQTGGLSPEQQIPSAVKCGEYAYILNPGEPIQEIPHPMLWCKLLEDFEKHNPDLADSLEMMRLATGEGDAHWTYAEIAKQFSVAPESVRSRVLYVTEAIKKYFAEVANGKE